MCVGACFCLLQEGRGDGVLEGGRVISFFIRSCRHAWDKAQRQSTHTPPADGEAAFYDSSGLCRLSYPPIPFFGHHSCLQRP